MSDLRLACLTMIAVLSVPPHTGALDDLSSAAEAALARCLASTGSSFPADAARVPAPPGLARNAQVEVVGVGGGDGRLFAYRGAANELTCGIALYGEVPAPLEQSLVNALDGRQGWARHAPGPYRLASARPARQTYWSDPLAPGLSGALLLERAPSSDAPTLEIDLHKVLVS